MADPVTVTMSVKKRWFFPLLEWALVVAVVTKAMSFDDAAQMLVRKGVKIVAR